jgi:ABC-type transporter Mla subunit MlaD
VLRGDFTSSNQLEPGNPVRIAGLQIGEVSVSARARTTPRS